MGDKIILNIRECGLKFQWFWRQLQLLYNVKNILKRKI